MRVPILAALAVSVSFLCKAQETMPPNENMDVLTTKRGRPILPQSGEWSIGIDATPFFNYVGNMFNNSTSNSAPTISSPKPPSLVFKYMKTANTAYRLRISMNSLSTDGKNQVDHAIEPDPSVLVTDTKNFSSTNILIGAGFEKRRGRGRVQGIYGIETFIGLSSNSSTYTYGNPFTPATPSVPFTLWNNNSVTVASVTLNSTRTLETLTGSSVSFGVTGFVGVEYFIGPKISIGGELGYSISSTGAGSGTQTTESFTGPSTLTKTTSTYSPSPGSFSIGTVPVGNIMLNMYF